MSLMLLKKNGYLIEKKKDLKTKKILICGNVISVFIENTKSVLVGLKDTIIILKTIGVIVLP